MSEVKKDDVVQLGPESPWPFTFAVVTEVRSWGVLAEIVAPDQRGGVPNRYPVRLEIQHVHRIGEARFMIVEPDEGDSDG